MNLEIRDAAAADAAAILPLVVELGVGFRHPPRTDKELVTRYLEQSGYGILLAMLDGVPVAFLAHATTLDLYMGSPAGEIIDLLVTEPVRNAGIGTALVAEAVRRFEAAGCSQVRVVTGKENGPAIRVYEKAGLTSDLLCLHRHFVADPRGDTDPHGGG
jgi:ribosomal protein S18 acetylase RimI-like enzyme